MDEKVRAARRVLARKKDSHKLRGSGYGGTSIPWYQTHYHPYPGQFRSRYETVGDDALLAALWLQLGDDDIDEPLVMSWDDEQRLAAYEWAIDAALRDRAGITPGEPPAHVARVIISARYTTEESHEGQEGQVRGEPLSVRGPGGQRPDRAAASADGAGEDHADRVAERGTGEAPPGDPGGAPADELAGEDENRDHEDKED